MKDVQKDSPKIKIPIQKVGITDLKLPIFVLEKNNNIQHTVANIDVFVDLDKNAKGIHMSRLINCAHLSAEGILSAKTIKDFAYNILIESGAKRSELIFKFPYFIKKQAPISKYLGLVHSNIEMAFINHYNKKNESFLSVETTTTSLCPCSKDISDYGAHNQRSKVTVSGKIDNKEETFWIEDIVKIIEQNSSCEIYSVLKRQDEKYVTEKAYENPNFVEDSVRNIYQDIYDEGKFAEFTVKVVNEESIHQSNAIAILKYKKEN